MTSLRVDIQKSLDQFKKCFQGWNKSVRDGRCVDSPESTLLTDEYKPSSNGDGY